MLAIEPEHRPIPASGGKIGVPLHTAESDMLPYLQRCRLLEQESLPRHAHL